MTIKQEIPQLLRAPNLQKNAQMRAKKAPHENTAFMRALKDVQLRMEIELDTFLPKPSTGSEIVNEGDEVMAAMRYASLGAGKRLRPFLLVQCAGLFGETSPDVWRAAAALEAIHVYSLIHDDLPAMDDDDMRRGRPSVHKAFDEAVAILAGDALQSQAFEGLAHLSVPAEVRLELISRLARAAGIYGMVGGQQLDMKIDNARADVAVISHMQSLKTGALIRYAAFAGASIAGADAKAQDCLQNYTQSLGLLFQITDDILDIEGDSSQMGKATRKDNNLGKVTFVTLLGLDGAKKKAQKLAIEAKAALEPLSQTASSKNIKTEKMNILYETVDFVLARQH